MGYSTSIASIEAVKEHLETVLRDGENGEKEIRFIHKNPQRLAYKLHNALKAAEKFKYERYLPIKERYRIRVRQGFVVLEPKYDTTTEPILTSDVPRIETLIQPQ